MSRIGAQLSVTLYHTASFIQAPQTRILWRRGEFQRASPPLSFITAATGERLQKVGLKEPALGGNKPRTLLHRLLNLPHATARPGFMLLINYRDTSCGLTWYQCGFKFEDFWKKEKNNNKWNDKNVMFSYLLSDYKCRL